MAAGILVVLQVLEEKPVKVYPFIQEPAIITIGFYPLFENELLSYKFY